MAITTTQGVSGLNTATQAVMNYMSGVRTKKQIVGEFFGLRQEAIYDDNGENVIDFINDFKDTKALEDKLVHYNDSLKKLGVTETDFNTLFYGKTVNYGAIKKVNTNGNTKKAKK